MELKSSKEELLEIFPRNLPGLDVIAKPNSETDLDLIYLQRNTYDSRRNWDAYQTWLIKREQLFNQGKEALAKKLPLPKDVDYIYDMHYNLVTAKKISKKDKIILEAYLIDQDNPVAREVYLSSITRNQDPSLKGIGSEFYRALTHWLRKKDFRFLTLDPDPKVPCLKKYWADQGTVRIKKLEKKLREAMFNPNFIESDSRVHDLSTIAP